MQTSGAVAEVLHVEPMKESPFKPVTQRLEAVVAPLTQRLEAIAPMATAQATAQPTGTKMPQSRFDRARRVLIGAYAAIALISLLWGLSGGTADNELGARVAVGRTGEGTVVISVRNESAFDWHNVRIEADGRFVTQFDRVGVRANVDARVRELDNVYRVPRPAGLFVWEAASSQPPPERTAPESYTPERIRVVATEGEHEIAVAL